MQRVKPKGIKSGEFFQWQFYHCHGLTHAVRNCFKIEASRLLLCADKHPLINTLVLVEC